MKKIYGFENIKKNILTQFLNNKLHHCNLLNGVEGCGKASFIYNDVATFILSETNSIKKEDINNNILEKTSKLIDSGGHTDLLVLDINTIDEDGKENSSKKGEINVNQTRRIIRDIKLTSSISNNKILIIDSIDNLNINAQNALLKTLEEPPKNTFLFLICHNINKVLTTIKSRSNIINVPILSVEDWYNALFSNEKAQVINLEDEEIVDLYNISNASVGFALNIIINNALNLYDTILNLILDKNDIIKIQQFSNECSDNEKFNLICVFFDKIFNDLINYKITGAINDIIKKRQLVFKNITKNIDINTLLKKYEYFNNIINDIKIYNLDKKHAINVFLTH